jgi:hypothetical protein
MVNDIVWENPCIYPNQGLTAPDNHGYKGSNFMLKKEWANGELTADLNLSGRDITDDDGILDSQDEELDYPYPTIFVPTQSMASSMRSFLQLKRSFLRIHHHHLLSM